MENNEKNSSPSVGQRIKAARKARGLTLTQLGELIGITNQALSAIERGKARPSRQTLKSLSRVLNEKLDGEPITKLREMGYVVLQPGDFQRLADYEEERYRRMVDAYEASRLPKPVHKSMVEAVYVPIHFEILNGDSLKSYEGEDRVIVPVRMVPVLKYARAVRVIGTPVLKAFAKHGDAIILTECSDPLDGKIVLVEVNGKVFLRRWINNGRKVKLDALDQQHDPLEVSPRKIKCVGEVTGMLESTHATTLPIPVCGNWPIEWAR